ncbi:MAG: hypothetical protein GF308_03520 [Candidatus Heimdallarchaeota archaeon]|nr:hypothetical protein [Candidatus Heimdallarchaeota archaeon]
MMKQIHPFFSSQKICFLVILLVSFSLANPISNATAANLSLSQIFLDKWLPGGAFGYPGFVGTGNFTNIEQDEILLVSRIPDKSDIITLLYFDGNELVYTGSADRDCSTVYQYIIADFDGNGDDELLYSDDWVTDTKRHIGSVHYLYDYIGYRFHRNEALRYERPGIQLDKGTTIDIDNDHNEELLLATWDGDEACELLRLYDYEDDDFILLSNYTLTPSEKEFFVRNIIFVGVGDFDRSGSEKVITISLWSLKSNPNQFYKSFEVYSYNSQSKNFTHEYQGVFPNLPGSNIAFEIGDIDLDNRDEVIAYLDRTADPLLSVYEISSMDIRAEYSILRPQSDYFTTNWYRTKLLVEDLDRDYFPEILIAETKWDSPSSFMGRYEIYKIQSYQLESISIQEISERPVNICTGDIDNFSDTEIINAFSSYSVANESAKGGMEIWTAGPRKTNQFSLANNFSGMIVMVIGTFSLVEIIKKRRKKLQS